MFKLNDTVYTKAGYSARIICVDSEHMHGLNHCPVVALVSLPNNASKEAVYFYSTDGKFSGSGNTTYDLMSNEPTYEERALMEAIAGFCDKRSPRTIEQDEQLLKIIRQIRSGKK